MLRFLGLLLAGLLYCGHCSHCAAQSLEPSSHENARVKLESKRGDATPFAGKWTYRSFHSNPDLSVEPNDLLFGMGELILKQPTLTSVSGSLGGDGWSLDLKGSADIGSPPTIRFQGRGTIAKEEWVYDYVGYLVPIWPNGVDQRPAIVGSIVRTKEHTQGQSKAGYVAQWIAVLQDQNALPVKEGDKKANQSSTDLNSRSSVPFAPAMKQYFEDLKGLPSRVEEANKHRNNGLHRESFAPLRLFQNPPEIRSTNGRLIADLTISYADHKIWNPAIGSPITLRHRSYNDLLVGATLRVMPGDLLRIKLNNQLPLSPAHHGHVNDPHGFNFSNLHTHGLHVSPAGNSDNVFVAIGPGEHFRNEIGIPDNHAAGTFWYHAHLHGSTAIQVSSGMAGALIVEGGVDQIPSIAAAKETVMLFQQIPFTKSKHEGIYELESYETFGPGAWDKGTVENGWRTLISAQYLPLFVAAPGEVLRWRMIDAGLREDVDVAVLRYEEALKIAESRKSFAEIPENDITQNVRQTNKAFDEVAVPLREIAADGLCYGRTWSRKSIKLSPGYRSDALLQFQEPGLYVVIDREAAAPDSLHFTHNAPKVLGVVVVAGKRANMSLPTDKELRSHSPHKPIADGEVMTQPNQQVAFNIDVSSQPLKFQINGQEFDPMRAPRRLVLGKATEWNLSSAFVNHPFHIHVNPFEILSMTDPDGKQLLPVGSDGRPISIWKDTVLVQQGHNIRLRMRHEDYIGLFVLHCHILDHEDRGMMESVEIVTPSEPHGH